MGVVDGAVKKGKGVGTKVFLRWFLSGPVTKRISDYSQKE